MAENTNQNNKWEEKMEREIERIKKRQTFAGIGMVASILLAGGSAIYYVNNMPVPPERIARADSINNMVKKLEEHDQTYNGSYTLEVRNSLNKRVEELNITSEEKSDYSLELTKCGRTPLLMAGLGMAGLAAFYIRFSSLCNKRERLEFSNCDRRHE